jgi:hypothetical protein
LNAQNNFYTFLKLAAILQKGKNRFAKKKEKRAGAADAGQAGPDLRPAQATRCRTGTPPSDPDRTARGLLPRAISHAGEAALES